MEVFLYNYSMREYILDRVGSTAYWVGQVPLGICVLGYDHMHPSG